MKTYAPDKFRVPGGTIARAERISRKSVGAPLFPHKGPPIFFDRYAREAIRVPVFFVSGRCLMVMHNGRSNVERAFELARTGEYESVAKIRQALNEEGYYGKYVRGRILSGQLRAVILSHKAQAAITGTDISLKLNINR